MKSELFHNEWEGAVVQSEGNYSQTQGEKLCNFDTNLKAIKIILLILILSWNDNLIQYSNVMVNKNWIGWGKWSMTDPIASKLKKKKPGKYKKCETFSSV